MESKMNPKEKFETIIGNSLRQQPDETTTKDLESGPINPQPTAATNYATGVFKDLLETIRETRYPHVDSEKRDVYKRLMNQLDAVEERHSCRSTLSLIAVELIVLSGLTAALACTLTLKNMKLKRFMELRMWQWVTMVLMIVSGLTVVRFATFVVFWPVKRWWRIHKYVVYFTRQLKPCVDVMLWLCVVLVGWYLWFRPRLRNVHGDVSVVVAHQVTRFLMALCLGSFLWLLKNVLYLKLEADLHYDQLFDRLQQTVVYLHGIQILHTRGMWKFLTDNKSKKKLLRMANSKTDDGKEEEQMKGVNIWIDVLAMDKESVPIWILRRLAEEYLDQVKLRPLPGTSDRIREDKKILRQARSLFKQLISKRIDLKDPDHNLSDHEVKRDDLEDCKLSKDGSLATGSGDFHPLRLRADTGIWLSVNVKRDDLEDYKLSEDGSLATGSGDFHPLRLSDHEVKRDDLKDYELSKDELDVIFKPSNYKIEEDEEDGEDNEDNEDIPLEDRTIGYDEFLNWAVRAYKNCLGLGRTLCSSKRVFVKLNRLLSIFLLTVMLIIWLLLSEIVNTGQLALLFAPFVAATFIFGDSCRRMFEGLIFAFAMHPFDVGDRVIIDKAQMRVKELNILTTIFYKYDTGEEVITPNSTLTTTSIINLDITPDQSDKVEFVLCPHTPLEDIKDLEIKIKKLLDDDIEYSSNTKVVKSEIGKEEIKMTVYFKYLVSYLTAEVKALNRSKILSLIMKLQKDMKINNREYPPSYKPYVVEMELACKLKMKDIEVLRSEMLSSVAGEVDSKVVIMELTKSRIKMGLYVGHLDDTKVEDKEKKEKDLCETLKSNKVVGKVKILQAVGNGDYEKIAGGGKKWGSFKAADVIKKKSKDQDHPSTSLETIPSGDAEAVGGGK